MSWPKGPRGRRRIWRKQRIRRNGEFDENLPKGLTKANELAQRALWKAANLAKAAKLAKVANLAKICQRV